MRKWTEQRLEEAVKTSLNLRDVLSKLGLQQAGGNYETIKWWIQKLNIETTHFIKINPLKGKKSGVVKKRPLDGILIENIHLNSSNLKKRLIADGIFKHICNSCQKTEWISRTTNNKVVPISLELEHKNGNKFDNKLENLELLCPICHSYTTTYGGRNIKRPKKLIKAREIKEKKKCLSCNYPVKRNRQDYCSRVCYLESGKHHSNGNGKKSKIPGRQQLKNDIDAMSWTKVGKKYGVSDNAVRKWASKYELLK